MPETRRLLLAQLKAFTPPDTVDEVMRTKQVGVKPEMDQRLGSQIELLGVCGHDAERRTVPASPPIKPRFAVPSS